MGRGRRGAAAAVIAALFAALSPAREAVGQVGGAHSVARQWNEELLAAIRLDYPAPTVHARNLFHLSAAMFDAWAAYTPAAHGYFVDEVATAEDVESARAEAISYAAYGILRERFVESKSSLAAAEHALVAFAGRMDDLGFDPTFLESSGGARPHAELGNRIARAVLLHGSSDGANEAAGYTDPLYSPVNPPMIVDLYGVLQPENPGEEPPELPDPNRWQPLSLEYLVLQNGIVVGEATQEFLGSHWGSVVPFALERTNSDEIYGDPSPPPLLGCETQPPCAGDEEFKAAAARVIRFSSQLDPADDARLDISPRSLGNNPLGTNDGAGYGRNPETGDAYPRNLVRVADFGRVLAEFWADGPESETPPGHWNTIANTVSDHPSAQKRIEGRGPFVSDLEWDVKLYFALNGALHDAAIAAWDAKARFDYVRPITMIRYMGGKGQSSDPAGESYHPHGLPLIAGLIERISPESAAPGGRHEGLRPGFIAIRSWPGQPSNPDESSGVRWIESEAWLPYQRETFVTPPFAGFVSGHSTFSRAAAEVLTSFTGDAFFPDGMGRFVAPAVTFLEFEGGPSEEVELQWATYYDAADQAGISRLWGGIHVDADDLEGRVVGAKIGVDAHALARSFYVPEPSGSALLASCLVALASLRRVRVGRAGR